MEACLPGKGRREQPDFYTHSHCVSKRQLSMLAGPLKRRTCSWLNYHLERKLSLCPVYGVLFSCISCFMYSCCLVFKPTVIDEAHQWTKADSGTGLSLLNQAAILVHKTTKWEEERIDRKEETGKARSGGVEPTFLHIPQTHCHYLQNPLLLNIANSQIERWWPLPRSKNIMCARLYQSGACNYWKNTLNGFGSKCRLLGPTNIALYRMSGMCSQLCNM